MGLHKGKPKGHRESAYQRAWRFTDERPCPVPGLIGSCWVFGGADLKGYGQIHADGRTAYVHHVGYEYLRGPRTPGMDLDHLCRVTRCWSPWHLEEVPHAENVRRGEGNGFQHKTHCPQGHEYTAENTYNPPGRVNRQCRACRREDSRRRYHARKK